MSQKFIFFVYEAGDYLGYAYCAKSREQAKYLYAQDFCVDYIDVRARKIKPAPQDFAIGKIDDWQWCLKEGVYLWVEEVECPRCGAVGDVFYDKNKGFYCDYCREEVFKESHDESGHSVLGEGVRD